MPRELRVHAPLASLFFALALSGCQSPTATAPVDAGPPDDMATRTRKPRTQNIDDLITYQPLTPLVDPFIGTGASGNTYPGATLPHGVVKLSPDTRVNGGSIQSYSYGSSTIEGFSHTHLDGPGGSQYGYSEILVVPTRGTINTTEARYGSRFSHASEQAEPGYYAVTLDDANARAELTATRLCGVHRYTFSGTDPGNVQIDVAHTRGTFLSGAVEVIGNGEVRGHITQEMNAPIAAVVSGFQRNTLPDATTGMRTVYFHAKFNRAFDSFGAWDDDGVHAGARMADNGHIGAVATFNDVSKPVEVSVCLSFIDADQAFANFGDLGGRGFDDVRKAGSSDWNKLLNRIQVTGGTMDDQRMLYTALYHSMLQPVDYTESKRFWSGEDGKGTIMAAPDWEYYSDDWCMWDTFRTTHPLQLLLEPERRSDIVNSMIFSYQRGGWLAKCSWQATGYSRVMTANPFVPIMVDAYLKGFDEYDVNEAWNGLYKASTSDQKESQAPGFCGYFNQGTPPDFLQLGYVSHECDHDQGASMTLEHSFDAWALSRMADKLGKTTERDLFRKQALNYKNVFNPAHGFMQGRYRDGTWVEPFDPASKKGGNDFTEASAWIYTWFVQHDARGLSMLLGGDSAMRDKLDQYFAGGFDDTGNEPSFHAPWLYHYVGVPSRGGKRVRDLMDRDFKLAPGGLPGNDDDGAMSAWWVWGAIGLYPITPGDDTLLVGSPRFDSVTIYLEPNFYAGKKFVIQTVGNSPTAPYVQSAQLNSKAWDKAFVTHSDVVNGGTLVLQMGNTESTWGALPANAPPSLTQAP